MAKNLVIVESPAKAKTIEGYLGSEFIVKSSYGHVRDLAKKGLAIEIYNKFNPLYEVTPDKKQLVTELKKLVKESEVIWLATDEDREGEAISWHLYETLGLSKKETKRITFNEITKTAILKSIEKPRNINKELVDAQQARRILDRIVGFELSPVLWKKIRPKLSAGRVQSVAVRLIVEREKESSKTKHTICCFEAAIAAEPRSHKNCNDNKKNYHHIFFYRHFSLFSYSCLFFSGLILFWFPFRCRTTIASFLHPVHLFVCLSVCVCVLIWGSRRSIFLSFWSIRF